MNIKEILNDHTEEIVGAVLDSKNQQEVIDKVVPITENTYLKILAEIDTILQFLTLNKDVAQNKLSKGSKKTV